MNYKKLGLLLVPMLLLSITAKSMDADLEKAIAASIKDMEETQAINDNLSEEEDELALALAASIQDAPVERYEQEFEDAQELDAIALSLGTSSATSSSQIPAETLQAEQMADLINPNTHYVVTTGFGRGNSTYDFIVGQIKAKFAEISATNPQPGTVAYNSMKGLQVRLTIMDAINNRINNYIESVFGIQLLFPAFGENGQEFKKNQEQIETRLLIVPDIVKEFVNKYVDENIIAGLLVIKSGWFSLGTGRYIENNAVKALNKYLQKIEHLSMVMLSDDEQKDKDRAILDIAWEIKNILANYPNVLKIVESKFADIMPI